jgi:hypothetical protein
MGNMTYLGNHTKNKKMNYFKLFTLIYKIKSQSDLSLTSIMLKFLGTKAPAADIKSGDGAASKIIQKNYSNNETNLFGSYLAGLIEGDGSIIVREGLREKVSPAIVFTFHEREMPLYKRLKEVLNSGSINTEKSGNCRFRITNANAVIKVINLVNGKFRTPKIEALGRAINNLNKWRGANLTLLPLDTSDIGSNA